MVGTSPLAASHLQPLIRTTGGRPPSDWTEPSIGTDPSGLGGGPASHALAALHTRSEHVPSIPHAMHDPLTGSQTPAALHATQSSASPPPHALSQHTPSTQCPDSQRSAIAHVVPSALGNGNTATKPLIPIGRGAPASTVVPEIATLEPSRSFAMRPDARKRATSTHASARRRKR